MAMILKFSARSSAKTDASAPYEGPCEVILFPGVRYERWSEDVCAPQPKPQKKRTAKKRKRAKQRA